MHRFSCSSGYQNGITITPSGLSGFHVSAERRGAGGTFGGDFYTLAMRAPGHIGVVIGDASGRASDAETQLSRIFPKVCELAVSGLSPARLLAELNRTVGVELGLDRFVTAAAFEIDTRTGVLTVANAAHVPAMVRRHGHVSVIGRPSGAPLGFSRSSRYVDERHQIVRGDVIVLMTDGVLEAIEGNLVTMSTLRRLFAQATEGAGGAHRSLLSRFEACTAGAREDDMTLVALEMMSGVRASNTNSCRRVN